MPSKWLKQIKYKHRYIPLGGASRHEWAAYRIGRFVGAKRIERQDSDDVAEFWKKRNAELAAQGG